MPFNNASRLLTLATLLTLAACSNTNPPNCALPEPPADMMQPPEVTDFLSPLATFLRLAAQPNIKPAN